jgi:hypothetical protein
LQDLMLDQEVKKSFHEVIDIPGSSIRLASADRDGDRARDLGKLLQFQLPASLGAPSLISRASIDAATPGSPKAVELGRQRQCDHGHGLD